MNQSHALGHQEPASPELRTDHIAPAAIRSHTEDEKQDHQKNHHCFSIHGAKPVYEQKGALGVQHLRDRQDRDNQWN